MEKKDIEFGKVVRQTTADAFRLIIDRLGIDVYGNDNETFENHVSKVGVCVIDIVAKYINAGVKFVGLDRESFTEFLLDSIRKSVMLQDNLDGDEEIVKEMFDGKNNPN